MLKKRKGSEVFKNFIVSYIVILMLPMFIMSFIVLFHFVNVLKEEVEINLRTPFIKSVDNFEAQINQLTRTTLQLELNDIIRNVNIQKMPYEAMKVKNELIKYSTNSFVDDIFFYNYSDDYVSSFNFLCSVETFNNFVLDRNLTDFDLIAFKESDKQSDMYFFPANSVFSANNQKHLMYLNKIPINSKKKCGIIMFMIPEDSLRNILAPALSENNYIFIVDPETREILFAFSEKPDDELTEFFRKEIKKHASVEEIKEIKVRNERFSAYVKEAFGPFLFVQLMPNNLLSSRINDIRIIYLISMAVIFVIGGFLIAVLMRINYHPIKKLNKLIEESVISRSTPNDKLNELELLEYALMQFNRENINLKEFAAANKNVIRNYLIDCFLAGQAKEIDNILKTCRSVELEFRMKYYCVILIKGNNIQNIPDTDITEIFSLTNTGINYQIIIHRDIHLNNVVVIYGSPANNEQRSLIIAREIQKHLNEKYNGDIRIGIGNFYDSIFSINTSYEEALRVLEYNSLFSKSNIISFNEIMQKSDQTVNYPFSLLEKLEESVRSGDIFGIRDTIDQLVDHMKTENLSLFWIKNICYDTVNTISKELLRKFKHFPLLNKPYMEKIYGSDINTFEDIVSIMKEISEDVTNYLSVDRESYELRLLQKIIRYIRENYQDPDFSLQSIADSLQMSPAYLSQYFKKNTEQTISEYVTRLRMEKAKELLLTTDMGVNEIAYEVGYYSVPSFIRKFREKEKVTPGQFKKIHSC